MSAMLLYIITNAVLFSFLMANENIPHAIAHWMIDQSLGVWASWRWSTCCCCAGNFMEPSSIILIMAPILFPAAMRLAIDPVHFGILIMSTWKSACATRRSGSTSMSPPASPASALRS